MSRTISTFQVGAGAAALSLTINDSAESACPDIIRISGYMNGTASTQYWIQYHRAAAMSELSNGAVPLRSEQVIGGNGFTFDYYNLEPLDVSALSALPVQGKLLLCVSTTKATLTKATTETMELSVEVAGVEREPGLTETTSSSVTEQATWTTANGPKRLFELDVTSLGALTEYTTIDGVNYNFVQIYADNAGLQRIVSEHKFEGSETIKLRFGGGLSPAAKGSDGTLYKGCYVAISSTRGAYTEAVDGVNITSRYKT